MTNALSAIKHLSPCVEAQAYLATQSDPATAWRNCQRGDWMLWLAARINLPRPLIVLAACNCARTALRHAPADEQRPLLAIEAAEAWAANPTEENRQLVIQARRDASTAASNAYAAASDAASSASAAAYASAAASAAACAADAVAAAAACAAVAHATNAALYASAASTYASTAASTAYAADATAHTVAYAVAAAAAARKQAQAQHADLVRARITAKLVANALAR